MKLEFLFFILVQLSTLSPTEGLTWTVQPTSATGIQGQSVSITWTADLAVGETWTSVKVNQELEVQGVVTKKSMIRQSKTFGRSVFAPYSSRDADLNLTVSLNGTLLTSVFTMKNLNRSTDEHSYVLSINFNVDGSGPDNQGSTDLRLTVLAPPTITSPNPKIVTVNESQTAQLECTVQGNPTPQVNWTRNGFLVGTGVYTTPAVAISDDNTCYTCIAYNGVLDAKTANVCLNVQYKPRNATILSDRSTVCQNSKVNLTCTSGPAKPAPSSYEFYNNDVLVGTSAANVYEATATSGLPDVNKFVCVPRNLVGGSLENGSVEVAAKVTPTVTQTLGNTETVVEGSNVTLACTASGTPTLNVTWTRTGKPDVPGLEYPIVDIKRGDAGLYQCTVNNGAECPANTADINVTVNYKPESTNFTISPSNEKFCQGNQITLTCTVDAKPLAQYSLYRNNQLVQGGSTTGVFNVQLNEKGDNTFTCVPNNTVGAGQNKSIQVFVKEAPTIVTSPKATTVKERTTLTLFCNASGLPAPNVTWTKVGGSIVGSTETLTISNIKRGEEGSYRCTASNGDECNNATVDAIVTVNYSPEITSISTNKSDNTFLKGNSVKLSFASTSKPQLCNVTFYHGNTAIQSYYDKTCAGADAASHVIQSIDGCNLEEYSCKAENQYGQQESKINLTINVPVTIATSPAADLVLVEGDALQLNCTATGCPTPNITWTKTGNSASLASGNGFFLSHSIGSLSKSDTGYHKCSVDNGVPGGPLDKTIYVNVTYKPHLTSLTSTLSRACLNDSVILNCSTNANPPAHEYRFYLNDQLVHTSMSGVYQLNVPQAGNNKYKCEPKNSVGAGQNASQTIPTKAPPQITGSTPDQTVVEGDRMVLMCNVTGSDPMNVTWSEVGGSSYPEGSSYTFTSIVRGDEATYQCTAHNGNECPAATATSKVTVNYKPENTNLTASKAKACLNDQLNLTCKTNAKPLPTTYRFFQNDVLIKAHSTNTYTFPLSVSGANVYKCQPENSAGNGSVSMANVTVKVSPIIVTTTPSQEIREGSSHTIYCNVQAQGEYMNVNWHKVDSGQVSSTGVYTIPSVTRADSGSYECRAHTGNGCEVKSTTIQITVISAPNISNIIVTEDSLTVTWSKLLLPLNTMAKCLIYVMESFQGTNWMKLSNTSYASSISCSISALKPSTLYHIQYALQIHENYVNGTIYIGTSAKVNVNGTCANSNSSMCSCKRARNISSGVSSTIFVAVIAVAVAVIVLLILVVIWMRFQDVQKNKRITSKEKNKTGVPLQTSLTNAPSLDTDTVYENEGFIFRKTLTKTDEDMTLYEQVRSRGRVMNQDVSGEPSFPMEDLQTTPGKLERKGGAFTAVNQLESQYDDPSYQSLVQKQLEAAKRVHSNQGSYGHLMDFTRRPDNNTVASPQEQNPLYQELQPENRSKHYQSLQDMQRPAFNV